MERQFKHKQIICPLEIAFLFFLIIKIIFLLYANPLPDEAYYWLWSKNIGLSYFDHPPLAAWTQSYILSFSDNKYVSIRALPAVSLGIVLTIMILWQRYLFKGLTYGLCLKSLVLFLAFPISTIFFSISFPDYLLITLLFISSFCLFLYLESNDKLTSGIHYWYLAVLFFSLALLTKYNAILFGIGVLGYILYYKKKIEGPSFRHIVASILIISLIQTPVLLWNLSNDFSSFSFHLGERLDQEYNILTKFRNIAGFLLGVLFFFSPIFIFNLANNYFFVDNGDNNKNFVRIGKFVLIFSFTFCIFLAFFTNVLYYWVTPALVLLIPFVTTVLKSKSAQYLHILYGSLISLILLINVSFYPLSTFFGNVDRETAILYGWEKIIDIVGNEKKLHGTEKVVFSDYRLGSLYIFHSGDFEADVLMEGRRTQFDIWRKKENDFAKTSLIVTDHHFPIGQKILSRFNTIELVKDIEIYIGDKLIKKYQVFLGTNT